MTESSEIILANVKDPETDAPVVLTGKEWAFIESYLQHWNGSRAARQAGYEGENGNTAYNLLNNPKIRAVIQQRMSDKVMQTDECLARLSDIARFDIGTAVKATNGKAVVSWSLIEEHGLSHFVKSIIPTPAGMKIEFHDSFSALQLVAKHLGVASRTTVEHTGAIAHGHLHGIAKLGDMSDAELGQYIANLAIAAGISSSGSGRQLIEDILPDEVDYEEAGDEPLTVDGHVQEIIEPGEAL